MFDADANKLELDKIEGNIDQVVLKLKEIVEQFEEATGTTVLLGLQDTRNSDAMSISHLIAAAKRHAEVVMDVTFSIRQLIWAYRPKL